MEAPREDNSDHCLRATGGKHELMQVNNNNNNHNQIWYNGCVTATVKQKRYVYTSHGDDTDRAISMSGRD